MPRLIYPYEISPLKFNLHASSDLTLQKFPFSLVSFMPVCFPLTKVRL